ncbi:hypothetical protein ACLOJK_032429 [Asimina triloba]
MASMKVDKPVGTQVPPPAKKDPSKAEGGVKGPAQKPAPKKAEPKAAAPKKERKLHVVQSQPGKTNNLSREAAAAAAAAALML